MEYKELLKMAIENNATDVFITVGIAPTLKIDGKLQPVDHAPLNKEDTEQFIMGLFKREEDYKKFLDQGEHDFSMSLQGIGRFRIGVYMQRGSMSAVIRVLRFENEEKLHFQKPEAVLNLSGETRGLVLITGPAGSGKSTTISQIIHRINNNRACHIITLEDPIEHLHKHAKSIVDQREIGIDTRSYVKALRSAMRQAPDVIQIGELRDPETIEEALTVAETGHLVISSLHTLGAVKTLDRLIDVFPASKQQQIRYQLSTELVAIVSQQFVPSKGSERILAYEIMITTPEIRKHLREGKLGKIDEILQWSSGESMMGMNACLASLFKKGKITRAIAEKHATDMAVLEQLLIINELC